MPRRLNPADPNYPVRMLRRQQRLAAGRLDRVESDSHTAGNPATPGPGTTPGQGLIDRVYIDPAYPDLIAVDQAVDDRSDLIALEVSTLMVPSQTDSDLMMFPTLA